MRFCVLCKNNWAATLVWCSGSDMLAPQLQNLCIKCFLPGTSFSRQQACTQRHPHFGNAGWRLNRSRCEVFNQAVLNAQFFGEPRFNSPVYKMIGKNTPLIFWRICSHPPLFKPIFLFPFPLAQLEHSTTKWLASSLQLCHLRIYLFIASWVLNSRIDLIHISSSFYSFIALVKDLHFFPVNVVEQHKAQQSFSQPKSISCSGTSLLAILSVQHQSQHKKLSVPELFNRCGLLSLKKKKKEWNNNMQTY